MTPTRAGAVHRTADAASQAPLASSSPRTDVPSSTGWLRQHTRAEHAAAESGLDLRRLQRPADLVGLLRGWETVWQAVSAAASAPGAAGEARAELLVPATQSLAWLQADLDALEQLPEDEQGPQPVLRLARGRVDEQAAADEPTLAGLLVERASAWGVAYVLRGSRLGGSVLAPQVHQALGLPPACGTAFLASQGSDPGREWVAFRRRLDALELGPADLETAGAAARWTFTWAGATTARGLGAGAVLGPRGHHRATASSR